MGRRCRAARRCQGIATGREGCIHRLPGLHMATGIGPEGASRCSTQIDVRRPYVDGTKRTTSRSLPASLWPVELIRAMHEIIYLIGLVVVVMFILGLLGVR